MPGSPTSVGFAKSARIAADRTYDIDQVLLAIVHAVRDARLAVGSLVLVDDTLAGSTVQQASGLLGS